MQREGRRDLRVQALATLAFGLTGACDAGCPLATVVEYATPQQVVAYFERRQKTVVTFVGYSGAGYENRPAMLDAAAKVIDDLRPEQTIINIGATPDGIGAVYELAKSRGFATTGIVSTQAKRYAAELSSCVDHVFYVEDDSWGGFVDGRSELSPTSRAMVDSSDMIIAIGGGAVARDELMGARRAGKPVRFIAADMDHRKAVDKAASKGMPGI